MRCRLDDHDGEEDVVTWRIFRDGTRVHGITSCGTMLLVRGGRKLRVLQMNEGGEFKMLHSLSWPHWVMAAALLKDGKVLVGLADHSIEAHTLSPDGRTVIHRAVIRSSIFDIQIQIRPRAQTLNPKP